MLRSIAVLLSILVGLLVPANAFWHGAPIVAPSQASAFGYTSLKFNTNTFANQIDLTNSKSAGFQWYLAQAWPNSSNYSGTVWRTLATQSTGGISVSGGAVTVTNSVSTGNSITTAAPVGGSFVGKTFGGGFYLEFTGFFTAQTPNSGEVAAVWAWPIEFLTGSATKWGEIDGIECTPISAGDTCSATMYIHEWTISGGGSTITDVQCNCGNTSQASPPISHNSLGVSQTYGVLWVPSSQNGGTGIIRRYFNNSEIISARQDYSPTGMPNPAPGNAAPANGQFSAMDSQNFVLIIGTSSTIPITISSVRVWQLP